MRWLIRDRWKMCFALVSLFFFLMLMALTPLSAVRADVGTLKTSTEGAVQPTPTVDLTVTALAKEQLGLQVKQLQNQIDNQNNWLAANTTAFIAAITTVIVTVIGFTQWAANRRDERRKEVAAQDKDLRAQAEERFKVAVTALGSDNEATQVGGAILLRSFLNKEDEEIYGRYYTQIFDLAVAYLRIPNSLQPTGNASTRLSLTPLRIALITVFKEVFPLARDKLGIIKSSDDARLLDASYICLDGAFLSKADLKYIWMPNASLKGANLEDTHFTNAHLMNVDFRESQFRFTNFTSANLEGANLSGIFPTRSTIFRFAKLDRADLHDANLSQRTVLYNATLRGANLTGANFSKINMEGIYLDGATLTGTRLHAVQGVTEEQLKFYKAKGAIIDEAPPQQNSESSE